MKELIILGIVCFISFVLFFSCTKNKFPTVSTSEISNITGNSAESGGTITNKGGSEIIARGVCWREGITPTVDDSKTIDGAGSGTYKSILTNLSGRTTYKVRSYAINDKGTSYGDELIITTPPALNDPIIANHNIVQDFDKIPEKYIAEVKKLMVFFPGESHSSALRTGMKLLESIHPAYSCKISTGEMPDSSYLRVNSGPAIGEARWFTWYAYPEGSRPVAGSFIKDLIREYTDQGHPINVMGFGWCWDMVGLAVSGGESDRDPVYGCRYWGLSDGGPDGNRGWGLDNEDFVLSGNRVCLDTYLAATQEYIDYCSANGYSTKVVFTTGTVDGGGKGYFRKEIGYQGYLKNERIREYVKADKSRILFDYADILCYDDNGEITTALWKGHEYPVCTSANEFPVDEGHISKAGAIRLAKAQWWLLARLAGWDGTY